MTQHVLPGSKGRIEQQFEEFHAAHPEVYDELVRIARGLQAQGYGKFGIATVYEVCRWRSMMRKLGPDKRGFALNNNYRAYYARLIMHREPDLAGVFNTRQLGVPSHVL